MPPSRSAANPSPKVAVIGAGNVGATCAQRILERGLADVALVDLVEGLAAGKALDLAEAAPLERHDGSIVGSTAYDVVEGARVVVVTAGLARKPGMSRSDLLEANAKIVQSIIPQVVSRAPSAVLIMVTNPLDAMTYLAWRLSGFPAERVLGMAGVLDAARLRSFVAQRLKASVKEVEALVLGGHGDSMVPLPRQTTVSGVPLPDLLPPPEVEKLIQRTREGGAEVVKLLKTGSAFYAPASSVAEMVRAILKDEKRLLPACVYLKGQYGLKEVFCGAPVRLGAGGVEEIVEIPLAPDEKAALAASADGVRREMQEVDRLIGAAA
ncbi:MAG: malate dehydrogenase [Candidatus Omnitrophica bacterium]|nr:malate dehydrogenase [Candidatus Omnitrophota bacterium]